MPVFSLPLKTAKKAIENKDRPCNPKCRFCKLCSLNHGKRIDYPRKKKKEKKDVATQLSIGKLFKKEKKSPRLGE